MILINIPEIKKFMYSLLKTSFFDEFELRKVSIQTFAKFDIDGTLCHDFFDEEEQQDIENLFFSSWEEIRPIVYELIKGKKLPKTFKIVLSVPEKKLPEIHENASSLFINILFENGELNVITGASQRVFSLDKSMENKFDDYVLTFLEPFNAKIKDE